MSRAVYYFMNSLKSKLISRSLKWKVGPLSKTHVLGRWPWLEVEEELSAKEIYLLDITENPSKFRSLTLLLYELAIDQVDLALAQVEGRALVQDARLGPVAVAGGG